MVTKSNRSIRAALAALAVALAPSAALAGPTGNVLSNNIRDADGTSGQVTTTGSGVKTGHIQNGAVTAPKLAPGAVGTAALVDGSVTTAKLANGSVTSAKLATGAVVTTTIADGSVTTAKVATGAVTAPKLANGAVTAANVAPTTSVPYSILFQAPLDPATNAPSDVETTVTFPHFSQEEGAHGFHGGLLVKSKPLNGLDVQGGAHLHAEIEGVGGGSQFDMYEDHAEMNLRAPNGSTIDAVSYDTNAFVEVNSWPATARLETDATTGAALILSSPNGTRWRITVSDTGVLSATPQ